MPPLFSLASPETANLAAVKTSWSDRWFAWRNSLLASRGFQRRAAALLLTRPIAKRRARALFDLVAGFVYSQVLLACVQLKLFDILATGPQTLAELASRLNLKVDALQRLTAAAVSLQLLEPRSRGRFGLGVLGATMVGNTAVAAMVEHHAALYADLADPVALLRGESATRHLAAYWPYANTNAPSQLANERVSSYSALMSASQPLVAQEILNAYPLSRHRCLLDVGGGEGTFLAQAAASAPQLQLMLFDLPAVAARASVCLAGAGLSQRSRACGGDFFTDRLPTGADVVSLIRVLHDHDDARVVVLLKAVHAALPPGGTLLIAEPMAGTAGAEPMGDAYFGLYLWAMGRGQARTPDQLTLMLEAAGFFQVKLLKNAMTLQTQILVARRSAPSNPHVFNVNPS